MSKPGCHTYRDTLVAGGVVLVPANEIGGPAQDIVVINKGPGEMDVKMKLKGSEEPSNGFPVVAGASIDGFTNKSITEIALEHKGTDTVYRVFVSR